MDNQIDQTTGTIKLRANFDNKNNKLFPNQFVNVRLLVQLKQNVTLVPTATVQRNSQTTYVFLVQPTIRRRCVRSPSAPPRYNSEVISGLSPGDVVVMTGVDKLQENTQVKAYFPGEGGRGRPGSSQVPPGAASSPAPAGKAPLGVPSGKGGEKGHPAAGR